MSPSPQNFARDWIAAWNAHDLDHILSHYAEDVTLISPRAKALGASDTGIVQGAASLRAYFARGLAHLPNLKFTLDRVYVGVGSVVLNYHTEDGRKASELMVFNPQGRVREVRAHYLEH